MDDHIITIGETDFCRRWKMTINLKELAEFAGKRVNDRGEFFVSVPMPRAKRLLRLIRMYGTGSEISRVDKYIKTNTKLAKYWRELCG